MTTAVMNNVWSQHAQQWNRVGYPLRPSARDGELMMALAEPALTLKRDSATVVILGVTREIAALPWPAYVQLRAVDQNAEMIAKVWQAPRHVASKAMQATWQCLPFRDRSVPLIVGDGALNCLSGLSEVTRVVSELARVLEDDGYLCIRMFFRPNDAETLDAVYADMCAGKIHSFHTLKWRIAMALATAPEFCVPVSDILRAFEGLFPNRTVLTKIAGWSVETIETIEAYRDADICYNFPTASAFRASCAPFFELDVTAYADGEIAERCPTMRLRNVPRKK